METAIAALLIITLILFGVVTLAQGYLVTQNQILEAWRAMEVRAGERARTDLLPMSAALVGTGDEVQITLRNEGSSRLADFGQWDVIIEYEAASAWFAQWYPYVESAEPGYNQWTVAGIYQDAAGLIPEALEPGILNPGEEMVIRVMLSPAALSGTTHVATVATPNGISASIPVSG